jgi:hypothetical protein
MLSFYSFLVEAKRFISQPFFRAAYEPRFERDLEKGRRDLNSCFKLVRLAC